MKSKPYHKWLLFFNDIIPYTMNVYDDGKFVMCFANTNINTVQAVAERIRNNVMKNGFIIGNERIHLTGGFRVHIEPSRIYLGSSQKMERLWLSKRPK